MDGQTDGNGWIDLAVGAFLLLLYLYTHILYRTKIPLFFPSSMSTGYKNRIMKQPDDISDENDKKRYKQREGSERRLKIGLGLAWFQLGCTIFRLGFGLLGLVLDVGIVQRFSPLKLTQKRRGLCR